MDVLHACLCVLILMLFIHWVYVTNHVKAVYYDVTDRKKKVRDINIVFLTDLHSNSYGKYNSKLVQEIQNQNPDMILIGGDMLIKSPEPKIEIPVALIKELVKIAPVYYANGNHEKKVMEYWEESRERFLAYKGQLEQMGVHYLIDASEHIQINGRQIEIIGLDLDLEHYRKIWHKSTLNTEELSDKIPSRSSNEEYRILMAHNPQYFQLYSQMDVDLVVSGHIHGGMIILPFLGGMIAPNLRIFPKYDFGQFRLGNATMVLSKGLGMHSFQIRLFNIPEISVIKI